jgi:hypothetical protein
MDDLIVKTLIILSVSAWVFFCSFYLPEVGILGVAGGALFIGVIIQLLAVLILICSWWVSELIEERNNNDSRNL